MWCVIFWDLRAVLVCLSISDRNQKNLHLPPETTAELLLSPRHLSSLMGTHPPMLPPSSTSSSYSSIRASPNFVVITIMEPPPAPASSQDLHHLPRATNLGYLSSSLDSMASVTQRWTVWNCAALLCQTSARVLVWVLGLLYFSSLPMGVYLLIMQRTTVGVLMVSLVPASLVLIMVYGLCQCICHELWDCRPPWEEQMDEDSLLWPWAATCKRLCFFSINHIGKVTDC